MQRWKIGHGDRAIGKTIKHMQALVLGPEGVGNPEVRIAALQAVRGAIKNLNEIDYVLDWIKRTIEFRGENEETLQSPAVTLQLRAGDCDDHAMLIAAMLRSVGYNVQFKTVAAAASSPGQLSHVYVVVQDKRTGEWKGVDSTVSQSFAGWEPPMVYRTKVFRNRALGDDATQADWANVVQALATPLVTAEASQIQYGGNPPPPAATSSIPSWVWILGLGAVAYYVMQQR